MTRSNNTYIEKVLYTDACLKSTIKLFNDTVEENQELKKKWLWL